MDKFKAALERSISTRAPDKSNLERSMSTRQPNRNQPLQPVVQSRSMSLGRNSSRGRALFMALVALVEVLSSAGVS